MRASQSGLRLLGVDFGEPFSVRTFSGSSRHIWTEFARRGVLVDAFTPYPSRATVFWYKLRAAHPGLHEWRARWRRSVTFRRYLSSRAVRLIREAYADRFNACLQIGAYYQVADAVPVPRGLLADNNCAITQRTNWRFQCAEHVFRGQYQFEREVYQSMDHIFCFSRFLANSMVEDFECDPGRVCVVGAGINLPEHRIHDPERDYAAKTILFVGYDWVQKGGPTLLRAFDLIRRREPAARLLIIGPRLGTVPSGAICYGPLSKDVPDQLDTICSAFRKATVLALPTLADAFPNVLREAMAAGLPCVASDTGAIPEIVDEGRTGFLVPFDDPPLLADRLLRIIQDPDLAGRMGAAGRERYLDRFTWSRVCDLICARLGGGGGSHPVGTSERRVAQHA